jgi:hypothetical protein
MLRYIFGFGPVIPDAPPLPTQFEIELKSCKLKHVQLGRNKLKDVPYNPHIVRKHLVEILEAKGQLKRVISIEKPKVYVPRHPVLRELINTVPRA